jgi:hypothetical protein
MRDGTTADFARWSAGTARSRRFAVTVAVALAALVLPLSGMTGAADAKKKKAKAPAAARWFPFAPFVDQAGYPPPDLPAIKAASGVSRITLGFITGQGGNSCTPTWGGYAEYPATGPGAYRLANIDAFRRAGGQIVVSFGGAAGAELATVCPTVGALTAAYRNVIKTYGASHVDFDIEGAALGDSAANARRAAAIASIQKASRKGKKKKKKKKQGLAVALTVPVLPSGMDQLGVAMVRGVAAKGVAISVVNGMAMDFGAAAAPSPEGQMGRYAIEVANSLRGQIAAIYPRLGPAQVWRKVGITPMIGINDVPEEKFTITDANQVVAFAKAQHIGMLSMWQVARDSQCPTPTTTTRGDCSGVDQAPWQFSQILGSFAG